MTPDKATTQTPVHIHYTSNGQTFTTVKAPFADLDARFGKKQGPSLATIVINVLFILMIVGIVIIATHGPEVAHAIGI